MSTPSLVKVGALGANISHKNFTQNCYANVDTNAETTVGGSRIPVSSKVNRILYI